MSLQLGFGLPIFERKSMFVKASISCVLSWRLCLRQKMQKITSDYVAARRKKGYFDKKPTHIQEIIHTLSQSARRLYHKHNYKGALSIWNYCAVAFGDHSSAAIVAYLLLESRGNRKGLGIPQNIQLAFEIAEEGTAKGSEECESVLALCHLFDYEKKTKKRSNIVCAIMDKKYGNPLWELAYAECRMRGYGSIKQNLEEAIIKFDALADLGIPYALVKMAIRGERQHREKYLYLAAEHEFSRAWYELGILYISAKNYYLAIECFIRAKTIDSISESCMIELLCDGNFSGCEDLLRPAFGLSSRIVVNIVMTFTWFMKLKESQEPPSTKYKNIWINKETELQFNKILKTESLTKMLMLIKKTSYFKFVLSFNETKDVITLNYTIKHDLNEMQIKHQDTIYVHMTEELQKLESSVNCDIQTKYNSFIASLEN